MPRKKGLRFRAPLQLSVTKPQTRSSVHALEFISAAQSTTVIRSKSRSVFATTTTDNARLTFCLNCRVLYVTHAHVYMYVPSVRSYSLF